MMELRRRENHRAAQRPEPFLPREVLIGSHDRVHARIDLVYPPRDLLKILRLIHFGAGDQDQVAGGRTGRGHASSIGLAALTAWRVKNTSLAADKCAA